MHKVLAGGLSATFNLDGLHGQRYVERRIEISKSLCEQLILHDQVIIPTQDYLTAAGLIALFGERLVIDLLESDRLRFIRLRGVFGYVRGSGSDGTLCTFHDPAGVRPQDSPIDASIAAGLDALRVPLQERKTLERLLLDKSYLMEMSQVLDSIKDRAFADLRHTPLWRDRFSYPKPGLLRLPGLGKMGVQVLGPNTNAEEKPIDALLALALSNIELYLAKLFECNGISTGSPIGDSLKLKVPDIKQGEDIRSRLWSFLEIASVPDLGVLTLADTSRFRELLDLTGNRDATSFREWFHQSLPLSEREFHARYVDLLHEAPWAQSGPVKVIRIGVSTALDAIAPAIGKLSELADTFLLDRLLKGNSAKYFVEDLRDFTGRFHSRR